MKKRFFARDISGHHPFGKSCRTDLEYARVANDIYPIIKGNIKDIGEDECDWMALKTALYLEDIVSEFGVWESFVTKNRELYGKELPFYDRADEYWMNEPNLNDVRFVLWSADMEVHKSSIVNPETPAMMKAADKVFEYLDAHFEEVPINEQLADMVFDRVIYDNFLKQRDLLKWMYLDCYLTHGRMADDYLDEAMDDLSVLFHNADDSQLYYGAESVSCFKYKTGPLAMYPKDYLAGLLRTKHMEDSAARVENQEFRDFSIYHVQSWDAKDVNLQDANGDTIVVATSLYDDGIEATLSMTDYCIGSYVRYGDRWMTNGITSWGSISRQFKMLQDAQREKVGMSQKSFEKLIKMASGERLLFAKDFQDVETIYKKAGLGELFSDLDVPDKSQFKDIVIYIDSIDRGVCIVRNAAKIIKSPYNPYFDPSLSAVESLVPLVSPDAFPSQLVHYLLEKDYLPEAAINSVYGMSRGRRLVQDNKDFIARFFRQDSY